MVDVLGEPSNGLAVDVSEIPEDGDSDGASGEDTANSETLDL